MSGTDKDGDALPAAEQTATGPDAPVGGLASYSVGQRLQRKREACGLTRADWSKRCGMGIPAIKAYESGRLVMESEKGKSMESLLDTILAEVSRKGEP